MDTQEFYIRHASETEARGPFSLEQLVSLAETGSVTADSLYYDATTEQWVIIGDNPSVKAAIFPERKKLTIKAKEHMPTLNKPKTDNSAPITVDDMLAAAEGRTTDTKDKLSGEFAAGRAAAVGMWSLVAMFLVSAAGSLLPAVDVIMTMDPAKIAAHPLAILGAIDLVFAVILGLGMASLYPVVRFRAACGVGFFGLVFFLQADHAPLLAAVAGGAGLYLCTIFVSMLPVLVSAALGLGGLGYVAYHFISR
ncbi:MAG: DUF4339 domain-containing protein [Undibacterium sp.]|nr:DUF4339 domain-containing protein [Opitutaceae bacterium]